MEQTPHSKFTDGAPAIRASRPTILVTGSPRSGTTWVGDILHQCPASMIFTEPFNPDLSRQPARVCDYQFREWFTYVTDENESDFLPSMQRMLELRHSTFAHVRESKSVRDAIDVMARGARYRLSRITTRQSIIKDPIALLSSEWLARRFVSHVVVLIRHPAAMVSSFVRLKFGADVKSFLRQPLLMRDLLGPLEKELHELEGTPVDNIDAMAMVWKTLYFAVLGFQKRNPDWLFIRHEDLSRDALDGFEKICRHIDLPFTPRVRRAVIQSDDASLPPEVAVESAFTTRRNAALNLTNWKQRLKPDEILRIRRRVEDVSHHFYSDADW